MADREKLAQLESVDGSTYGGSTFAAGTRVVAILLTYILVMAISMFGIAWFLAHLKPIIIELSLAAIVSSIGIGMLGYAIKLMWNYYYFRTSNEGLSARSILRKKVVPWTEVISIGSSEKGDLVLLLRDKQGKINIPMDSWPTDVVCASVLQHLRWADIDDSDPRYHHVLSFWEAVAGDVPREMEWADYRTRPLAMPIFFGILITMFVGATTVYVGIEQGIGRAWFPLAGFATTFYVSLWGLSLRPRLANARYVRITEDSINVKNLRRSVQWAWSEIGYARFWTDGTLYIAPDSRTKGVHLATMERDPESFRMVLAAIRHLHEKSPAPRQPIPYWLSHKSNGLMT